MTPSSPAVPRAVVALADGTEEMEAVICIDVLRRAGWEVQAAGISGEVITASRGVGLLPDTDWETALATHPEVLVLPGGLGGVEHLMRHEGVLAAVRDQVRRGAWLAAICAAPLVLQAAGVLEDRRYTSHPGVADRLIQGVRLDDPVVVDGRLVTSQGPGTSFAFALRLVAEVDHPTRASELATAMVFQEK